MRTHLGLTRKSVSVLQTLFVFISGIFALILICLTPTLIFFQILFTILFYLQFRKSWMIFNDLLRRSQRISSLQDLLWISSKCLQKIFIKFLSRTFNKNRFEIKYFLRSSKDLQLKSFRDPWESSKKIIPLFLIIS